MNLIEEIESADTEITSEFRMTDLWPRIKAALEAAQEMDRFIEAVSVRSLNYRDIDCGLVIRKQLRAAMEEK